MATTYEIPITPGIPQRFSISVAGVLIGLRLVYRDAPEAGWIMDILDRNDKVLVAGQPLVTGCDLLDQYPEICIPAVLWVGSEDLADPAPTLAGFGAATHLYFQPYQ